MAPIADREPANTLSHHFARELLTAPSAPIGELLLLGPPRLLIGDRLVQPGARKALALLAFLQLDGRGTRSKLAAIFWPDLDAASARRNLRRELHRLRSVGADVLLDHDGDTLTLDPRLACDASAFDAALATGDTARGVALYRGPLLDGFDLASPGSFEAWAASRREQFASRFRGAMQTEITRHIAAGRMREALDGHLRLIHEDGLHERHYRDAMELHARLGEREAALNLFERCRRLLGRELGLRPMPETLALAEDIRRGASRLAPPAAARTAAPAAGSVARLEALLSDPLPLQGRGDAQRAVRDAAALGRTVWLQGEAGVGKTRLALEVARSAGAHAVLHAHPGDAAVPYATLTRWLRAHLAEAVGPALPVWVQRELAHLLPGYGAAGSPVASDADRARLHAALDEAVRQALPRPLAAIVFDDWHVADPATVAWWQHAGERGGVFGASSAVPPIPDAPLRLVTLRDAECPEPLRTLRDTHQAAGQAELLAVSPWSAAEVQALVCELAGAPHDALATRLHAATAGNPLFVHETLRHLAQLGQLQATGKGWSSPFDAAHAPHLPVPPSVLQIVLARLAPLDTATRRLLDAASLAGGSFEAADLAGTTPLDDFEAVESIERACALRLLARDGAGSLHFTHALIADALGGSLSPERQRLLHRRLASALERRGGAPARIARHLELAGAPAQALRWRLAAAAAAEAVYAHAQALAEYSAALAHAPAAAQAAQVQRRRAAALQKLSRPADADAAFAAAEQSALDAGLGDVVVATLIAKADHLCASSRADEGLAIVDALLQDNLLSPTLQVQALEVRADALVLRGAGAEAVRVQQDALARLPGGASHLRGRLQMAIGRASVYSGDFDLAGGWFDKAMRNYTVLGALDPLAKATFMRGTVELNRNRYPRAAELLDRSRELGARAGNVPVQRGAILNLVKLYTQTGEVAAALQAIAEGEALSPLWESRVAEGAFLQARYYCHVLLGQLGSAFELLPRVLADGERIDDLYWHIGAITLVLDLLLLAGDHARADALLAEARGLCGDDRDGYHLPLLEAKRAWLQLLQGDAAGALARVTALDAMGPGATIAETVDLRRHVEAGAHLALGDAAAALAAVPEPQRSSTEESKALQWAVRVGAEARLGRLTDATREAVAQLLTDESRLPALEGLVLRRAFAAALAPIDAAATAAHAVDADATRRALLQSLAAQPAHPEQAALLAAALPALHPSNERVVAA